MPRMPFPRKTVMKHLLLIFAVSYAVCLPASVVADDLQSKTSKWLLNVPKPKPVDPPGRKAIEASIDRGIDFLLEHQSPNGSWGSATNTKGLNIYAPIPGAHYAFRAAVTSLCVSALIESEDQRPEVAEAIDRAEVWLDEWLPQIRRAEPMAIYNVWAHAYALRALVDLHEYRDGKPQQQERIIELMKGQTDRLQRYDVFDGGWV